MPVLIITFVLLFAALITAIRAVLDEQSLTRIFAVTMSAVLLYVNGELIMWSMGMPVGILLCAGIVPLLGVMVGFRVYEKSDEKPKRQEVEL